MFGEKMDGIVVGTIVLVEPDVPVSLTREEQNIVVAPERHQHARRLIDDRRLEVRQRVRVPETQLAIRHLGKSGRGDPVVVA